MPPSGDLRVACSDDKERLEPGQCDGVEAEQVAGQDRVGLGTQELRPGRPGPPWCGVDRGGVENLPHGGRADLVAEVGELAAYASVSPSGFSVASAGVPLVRSCRPRSAADLQVTEVGRVPGPHRLGRTINIAILARWLPVSRRPRGATLLTGIS